MTAFLEVDAELKRTLGFLPDDEAFDAQSEDRLKSLLVGAELYVQNAIGEDDKFYQKEEIKALYKLACYATAANWFNHPVSATASTTAMAIIGQLRGKFASYEEEEQKNGSTSESGSAEPGN